MTSPLVIADATLVSSTSSSIIASPNSAYKKCINGIPACADARLCCAALLNCVVSCGATGQPDVQNEAFQALRLLLTQLSLEQRESALNYCPSDDDLKVFAGTPLFLAAKLNLPDVARLLIDESNGAQIAFAWNGVTPLEIALRMKSHEVLAVFEEAIGVLEDVYGADLPPTARGASIANSSQLSISSGSGGGGGGSSSSSSSSASDGSSSSSSSSSSSASSTASGKRTHEDLSSTPSSVRRSGTGTHAGQQRSTYTSTTTTTSGTTATSSRSRSSSSSATTRRASRSVSPQRSSPKKRIRIRVGAG
jgi:uncharacterized membrane protein YgcG